MESFNKVEALNGNKSALIESGLKNLLDEFKGCTGNVKELTTPHIKSGTLARILKYLDKNKIATKNENEATSISIIDVNSDDGSKKENDLTLNRLRAFWDNPNFKLAQRWPDVKDFIIALHSVVLNYEKIIAQHHAEKREKYDAATEALYGLNIQRYSNHLGQSLLPPTINDADKEFIYNNLRTNSGELYWVDKGSGKLSPIFMEESSGNVSSGCQFLDEWGEFAYPLIKKYQDEVILQAELMYKGTPIENGLPVESFDSILVKRIPRIILQNMNLITKFRKDGESLIPDGFEVGIHGPTGGSIGMSIENWRMIFTKTLHKYVNKSKVTSVKQFSNTKGAGITYFSLAGINTNGNKCTQRPELPTYWKSFIFGPDGNKPIFACDVEMSLLRLAYFVANLVSEDSYSRQILFCAGGGNDGKTTLCTTLSALLGNENAVAINPTELDKDGNRIGLINKSFVYMPDVGQPSKILDNSIVKQLTGRDTMAMRKLYCSPFTYTPEHCFVAVTTNKTIYAKGIHQTSRILPLTFQINYTAAQQKAPTLMQSELLSERTEILQWCFDMLRFYRERQNKNGETLTLVTGNGLRLMTDARYNEWLNGECVMEQTDDIDMSRKIQLTLELEALNNGPGRFVALSEEDSEETDDELFDRLFDVLFTKDATGFCSKADLHVAIINGACDKYHPELTSLIKALGFKTSDLNYCNRFRCFKKHIGEMEGVVDKPIKRGGKTIKAFSGIVLKYKTSEDDDNDGMFAQPQTSTPTEDDVF